MVAGVGESLGDKLPKAKSASNGGRELRGGGMRGATHLNNDNPTVLIGAYVSAFVSGTELACFGHCRSSSRN